MKIAIWIEQGITQLVLTPDNEWEKAVTRSIALGEQRVKVIKGSFYECRGGWMRQGTSEESLILRIDLETQDPLTCVSNPSEIVGQ